MSGWKSAKGDTTERRDPMADFANRIVAELERGVKPWVRDVDPAKCGGPQSPFNPITKHRYRGINVLILGMDLRAFQTGDSRWMTYHQAQDAGYQVRKGEKSTTIFFYKPLEVEDDKASDGTRLIPILKSFAVFHASQIDGLPAYAAPTVEEAPWRRPEAAEIILQNSGAIIRTGGDKAFYSPASDFIQLPPDAAFRGPEYWATTALHELGHWTGHASRLNRDMGKRYGGAGYAMEELRAEISSAFIAGELGIPADVPNHASYIQGWLKPLKDSKHEIFRAAADAHKIVDLVLSYHPDFAAAHQPERPATPPKLDTGALAL